jgi:hypothetical protein
MGNEYLQVIDDAERNNWCVMLWCSTCYADKFRSAVKGIPDLQSALESLDLDQFTSHKDWYSMLRITVMDHRRSLNWGTILRAWLPLALQHTRFADVVLYHIVNRARCDRETRNEWITACLDLALRTKHVSLLESLVRILGPAAANHKNLVETAMESSANSALLKNALAKAGFIPSDEDIRREKKRKVDILSQVPPILRTDQQPDKTI